MDSWIEIADQLRERYILSAAGSLDRMNTLVERLADYPKGQMAHAALAELRRILVRLSASGASYGLPGISARAADGERRCAVLIRGRRLPAGPDLARLRSLLRDIDAELAAPPAGRHGGATGRTGAEPVPCVPDVAAVCQLAAPGSTGIQARRPAVAMR
jgi:hypothetical protein